MKKYEEIPGNRRRPGVCAGGLCPGTVDGTPAETGFLPGKADGDLQHGHGIYPGELPELSGHRG